MNSAYIYIKITNIYYKKLRTYAFEHKHLALKFLHQTLSTCHKTQIFPFLDFSLIMHGHLDDFIYMGIYSSKNGQKLEPKKH